MLIKCGEHMSNRNKTISERTRLRPLQYFNQQNKPERERVCVLKYYVIPLTLLPSEVHIALTVSTTYKKTSPLFFAQYE